MNKLDHVKVLATKHGIFSAASYPGSERLCFFLDHKNGKGVSDLACAYEKDDAIMLACGFKASYMEQDKNIKRHIQRSISNCYPSQRPQAKAFMDELIPLLIEWGN